MRRLLKRSRRKYVGPCPVAAQQISFGLKVQSQIHEANEQIVSSECLRLWFKAADGQYRVLTGNGCYF